MRIGLMTVSAANDRTMTSHCGRRTSLSISKGSVGGRSIIHAVESCNNTEEM